MSALDSTIALLVNNPLANAANGFEGICKSLAWDSRKETPRSSTRFGEDGSNKADAYAFSQFLITNHNAVLLATPRGGHESQYLLLARIVDVETAILLKNTTIDDKLIGSVILASCDHSRVNQHFLDIIRRWKEV